MSEISYQQIRSSNQAREADELRTESRRKNLIILVLHYLNEHGYLEAADALSKETNLDMSRFEVCDNIDLDTVLMEYESYYYVKLGKYPKITKKLTQSAPEKSRPGAKLKSTNKSSSTPLLPRLPPSAPVERKKAASPPPGGTAPSSGGMRPRPKSGIQRRPPIPAGPRRQDSTLNKQATSQMNGNATSSEVDQLGLQGLVIQGSTSNTDNTQPQQAQKKHKFGQIIDIRAMLNDVTKLNVEEGTDNFDRLLKPLGGYVGYNSEWRDLAQVITRDIYSQDPNVKWADIIGLESAKRLVKEAVVYPIKYPQLFTGILSPWKGLLLYGPPGTGKTLLAKAVATECNTTFFNISASSIVSKWRGDSEKLVRVLFELARFHAPSTIFLDELESLMSQRGGSAGGEHEGSRRMKTELLIQMDGLAKTDDLVFLLAASNLPWELDHAMLRRLEKRILVELPTKEARDAMFQTSLPPRVCCQEEGGLDLAADLNYELLAEKTEGYSGSDIKLVCKEAAMRPVRKIFDALESHQGSEELHIELDTLTNHDVLEALKHTKPSARTLGGKYREWQKEYESV